MFGVGTKTIVGALLSFLVVTGCASKPFPYYDSAINDHNRAPSSLAVPVDENVEQINRQAKTDYSFITPELNALEGQK